MLKNETYTNCGIGNGSLWKYETGEKWEWRKVQGDDFLNLYSTPNYVN
jgi:hypothetical protein